jgi:hypothetical protein
MSLYNEKAGEPPELMGVGAGAGGGYGHTNELRTMNYREAMASPDRHLWEEAIRQEYLKFVKFGVFEVIPRGELPSGKKLITCAWAIKLKRNGQRSAHANTRGFEQIDGQHYFSDSISSPVSNPLTVRALLTLCAMNPKWEVRVIDVEGAHFCRASSKTVKRCTGKCQTVWKKYYGSRKDVVY